MGNKQSAYASQVVVGRIGASYYLNKAFEIAEKNASTGEKYHLFFAAHQQCDWLPRILGLTHP